MYHLNSVKHPVWGFPEQSRALEIHHIKVDTNPLTVRCCYPAKKQPQYKEIYTHT